MGKVAMAREGACDDGEGGYRQRERVGVGTFVTTACVCGGLVLWG